MIIQVITCDRCNPSHNPEKGLGRLVGCSWEAAREDFGWCRIGGQHVCQDCQVEVIEPRTEA